MELLGGLIGAGASIFNGIENRSAAQSLNNQNIANQLMFARNRIQWTVADANKAGINPLAALGNATQTYSNVTGDTGLGDSVARSGQDIGRAVAALAPIKVRNAELENLLLEAKIRNFDSDTVANMKAASDIHKNLGQPGTPPGVDVPFPRSDPRGPVEQLEQRFWDRDGKLVTIPSVKAASPLQTLGALPTNALMAIRSAGDYVEPFLSGLYGQASRAVQDFNAAVYNRNNPY